MYFAVTIRGIRLFLGRRGRGRGGRRAKGKSTERGEGKFSLFPAPVIVSNLSFPNPLGRLDSKPGYCVTFLVRGVVNFVGVLEALVP